MSSGAHTHAPHSHDMFYCLYGYSYSLCVIFIYKGNDSFEVYFVPSAYLTPAVLKMESVMLFKVPKNQTATFKITNVATGVLPADQGKYLIDMQLHPCEHIFLDTMKETAMTDLTELRAAANDPVIIKLRDEWTKTNSTKKEPPLSFCQSDEPECPGKFSPCKFGESVQNHPVHGCGCYPAAGGGDGR